MECGGDATFIACFDAIDSIRFFSLFIFIKISITIRNEWGGQRRRLHMTPAWWPSNHPRMMRRGQCWVECARGWSYVMSVEPDEIEFTECAEVEWIPFAARNETILRRILRQSNSIRNVILEWKSQYSHKSRSQQSVGSLHIPRNRTT